MEIKGIVEQMSVGEPNHENRVRLGVKLCEGEGWYSLFFDKGEKPSGVVEGAQVRLDYYESKKLDGNGKPYLNILKIDVIAPSKESVDVDEPGNTIRCPNCARQLSVSMV